MGPCMKSEYMKNSFYKFEQFTKTFKGFSSGSWQVSLSPFAFHTHSTAHVRVVFILILLLQFDDALVCLDKRLYNAVSPVPVTSHATKTAEVAKAADGERRMCRHQRHVAGEEDRLPQIK